MTEFTTPPETPPEIPPASEAGTAPEPLPGGPGITLKTSEALRRTKPWVQFISVLLWIGVGFMLLASLFMMFAGLAGSAFGSAGLPEGLMIAALSLVYVVSALLYVFPAIYLWRYGSRIGRMLATASVSEMEGALEAQKSFWKFIGVAAIVVMGLYALLLIAMMIFGIIGAMS